MPLFEVEGWDLDNKTIKYGDDKPKKAKKVKKDSNKVNAIKDKKLHNTKKTKVDIRDTQDIQGTHETKVDLKRKIEEVEEDASSKSLTPLQKKMFAKLSGSRFRFINEKLYTITSQEALDLIRTQPNLFDVYHQGFLTQVQSWPQNPVDVFVQQIKTRLLRPINAPGGLPGLNRQIVIADMGCGELKLSHDVSEYVKTLSKKQRKDVKVHSFDLKKLNSLITVLDISNVPLPLESCSIVIFCLLLMGTNFLDFINELHRILIPNGELWISEIKSRFTDDLGDEFINSLKMLGFFHKLTDNDNKMFTRFEFFKPSGDIVKERMNKLKRHDKLSEFDEKLVQFNEKRNKKESEWLLKPCIYKRR